MPTANPDIAPHRSKFEPGSGSKILRETATRVTNKAIREAADFIEDISNRGFNRHSDDRKRAREIKLALNVRNSIESIQDQT